MTTISTWRGAILALALLGAAEAAAADTRIERTLALEPGGRLILKTDSGRITLRGASRSGIRVIVSSPRDDVERRFELTFEERAGEVAVTARERGPRPFRWFYWRGDSLHFEVEVPTATDLDLRTSGGRIEVRETGGEARVHTSGGGIELVEIAGDVEASTSGGSIRARAIGGDLQAHTSGGSIGIEGVGGDLRAETSGGSITLSGLAGRADASTSGGSVSARFLPGNSAGGSLSTSGGSVTAWVSPSARLDIEASTSSGRVTFDLPLDTSGRSTGLVRGRLNGGGAPLRLSSSGGSIRVKSL